MNFSGSGPEQFGVGQSDPAIQALVKGDAKGALEIWKSNDADRENGVTARHNLAIFWHLAALEWENKSLTSGVDRDAQSEKEAYWCRAFEIWEGLILDNGLWERFTARIRH